jgi:hypothetical protein
MPSISSTDLPRTLKQSENDHSIKNIEGSDWWELVYKDVNLNISIGIAAIDIARSYRALTATVYSSIDEHVASQIAVHFQKLRNEKPNFVIPTPPTIFAPIPAAVSARCLVFPLPITSDNLTSTTPFSGFYLSDKAAAHYLAALAAARATETNVDRARERVGDAAQKAGQKINTVGKKVFGALNSFFARK